MGIIFLVFFQSICGYATNLALPYKDDQILIHFTDPQYNSLIQEDLETLGSSRQKVKLSGARTSCFLVSLTIQNQAFSVAVDSGSADTALPLRSLNAYNGIASIASSSIPPRSSQLLGQYEDGSYWYGFPVNETVSLSGTNITGIAPLIVMTEQSTNPVFVDGSAAHGSTGIAFQSVSVVPLQNPATVVDAWFKSGMIKKNQITIHACPYSKENQSYIDFGNDTPYTACNGVEVTVKIPTPNYYNLNITQISVNNEVIALPEQFQNTGRFSHLDSCTNNIFVPRGVVSAVLNQMIEKNAISNALQASPNLKSWANGTLNLCFPESNLYWELLPNISFTVNSGFTEYKNVSLIIGPRQYIQSDASGNCWGFALSTTTLNYAVLGLPLFTGYHITLDRGANLIKFQPGCGCNTVDKFPLIKVDGKYQSCAAVSNTTANATTTMTCQIYTPRVFPTPSRSPEPTLAESGGATKNFSSLLITILLFLSLN